MSTEARITDEELIERIDEVIFGFEGSIHDLYESVGLIVVGRFFGWEVARLTSSRKAWTTTTRLFGDPKVLMRSREKYARKSRGLEYADRVKILVSAFVKGKASMPGDERRMIAG